MKQSMTSWRTGISQELTKLGEQSLLRDLSELEGPQRPEMTLGGRTILQFCSNDYLGLASHRALQDAAIASMSDEGFGAGASRLIVGNFRVHRDLEQALAHWKGAEAALLFNSGYQANVGLLAALAGPGDAIYSDSLNHASLIDGARLSRSEVVVYGHRDHRDLAARLSGGAPFRRRIIITESLFSMDGDRAPLAELAALAKAHDCLLVVDEAHAAGVLGVRGAGLASHESADLRMGTLGKAFGGFGAYVAGSEQLIRLLINKCRSFIFTTALPVPIVAAARAALDLVAGPEGDQRRRLLQTNVDCLDSALRRLGCLSSHPPSHIVSLVVGDAARTIEFSQELVNRGILIRPIRPPTVPSGTSRLRISITSAHTDEHLQRLIGALQDLAPRFVRRP